MKRFNEDIAFKLNCGFLVSDNTPSESSYSWLTAKLEESNILEEVQELVITQAIADGFITDDTVAIDATHFEARDQAPSKEEKPKNEGESPKKNVKNGSLNRLKKKRLCHFSKRKKKLNWMPLWMNDARKFHKIRNGASKRTVKVKMFFGLVIKAIWLSVHQANIFYRLYSLRAA